MKKILLVDDSSVNRYVLKKMLEIIDKSYIVEEVSDGKQAIDKHKQVDYDLIFMDVIMPVMDGIEATTIIRYFDSDVKIVGLTGQIEKTAEYIKKGMNRVMSKPLSLKDLRLLMEDMFF